MHGVLFLTGGGAAAGGWWRRGGGVAARLAVHQCFCDRCWNSACITMAEVEVQMYTSTEKKVRKVKKTSKRRESSDQGSEVTITEIEKENQQQLALTNEEGYVLGPVARSCKVLCKPSTAGQLSRSTFLTSSFTLFTLLSTFVNVTAN